jgi:hypothetical protein
LTNDVLVKIDDAKFGKKRVKHVIIDFVDVRTSGQIISKHEENRGNLGFYKMIDDGLHFLCSYTIVIGVKHDTERCDVVYAIFYRFIDGQVREKIDVHAYRK